MVRPHASTASLLTSANLDDSLQPIGADPGKPEEKTLGDGAIRLVRDRRPCLPGQNPLVIEAVRTGTVTAPFHLRRDLLWGDLTSTRGRSDGRGRQAAHLGEC